MKIESLTNARLRNEIGNISLVPESRRVNGPNASIVMAPFTHCSPSRPSRFTDGTYGVYYAGHTFSTALVEVAFHMGRFHAATNDPPQVGKYRAYKGSIDTTLHDVSQPQFAHLLNPDINTWNVAQSFSKLLRQSGSDGIVYPSVRHKGGECIAAFWPDVVSLPIQERHVDLKWDGSSISTWFDGAANKWKPMPKTSAE